MSCDCEGIEAVKTETFVLTYVFPDDIDMDQYSSQIRIAESEGATVLFQAGPFSGPNGSVTQTSGSMSMITIQKADLITLPNGDPVSEPWVGVFEVDLTHVSGNVTRLDYGPFVLEKGV